MKRLDVKEPEVRVLICTNERLTEKPSCKPVGGHEFFLKIKDKIGAQDLYRTHQITRTGCLGYCNPVGCVIEIKRRGKPTRYFSEVTDNDFDTLWREIVDE